MILIPEDLHTGADVPGFALTQTAGPDDLLDFFHGSLCQCFYIGIFCIKILNDYIYSCVCTLGGQPDAYQQLPGLIIVQGTLGQGILFL